MQKSLQQRLDELYDEDADRVQYDKQLGILGAEKIFSQNGEVDSNENFRTMTDNLHDEMGFLEEMSEDAQLIVGGIDSIIDLMKTHIFKVRLMNTVNDLIRPLKDQLEILHLEDRIHQAEQHTDDLAYYRAIVRAIKSLGTPNGGALHNLVLEYRRFTNDPLWSTLRITVDRVLLPMVQGISKILFGTGDRDSVEQKILKAIKQQTEFIRTGQIDQSDGFMKRLREQGILGMGARVAASSIGSAYLGISKGTAQERENQRASGETVTGGLSGWLSDKLYGGQTTLLDRTKHSTKSIAEELQDAVLNVRIVDGVEEPTPSDTVVNNTQTQEFLLSDVLKDAYGSIKSDFHSVVEVVKRASKAPIEQVKKAMEYSYQAMNSGQVLDQQEQTGMLFPVAAANQADDITVKAVVGGEDFATLTDHVNRTNSNLVNLFEQNENFRDEEFLELQKRDKQFDMVSKMQMEMQEAANDDLADLAKINKAQYRVQQRTRRAVMLGNMMNLVGTIAGGVLDVVKGIGGLAAALVGANAVRGVFGGGGRKGGGRGGKPTGRPAGKMPIRGLGLAGIASIGTGLLTERLTEEGTTQRRVGDTASSALGWGATGAMIGSVIPGIGTAVGGAVGAVAGALYANRDQFEGVIEGVRDTVTNIGSSISDWWSGTDETDSLFERIGSRVSAIGENIAGWWQDLKDNPAEKVMDVVAKASPFGLMMNAWNKTKGLFGGDDEASSERQSLGQVYPTVAPINTVPTLQHQQLMRGEDYSVGGMMDMYRGIASNARTPEDNSGWLYNRALYSGGQEVMSRRNSDTNYSVGGMMDMYRGIASNARTPEDNSGWLYNRALHSGGQEAMARRNSGTIPTSSRDYIDGIPADIYRQRLLQVRSAEIADSIWDGTVGQARGVTSPLRSEATDMALRNNGVDPSTGDGNRTDIVTSGTMAERHRARRNEAMKRVKERVQENQQNAPLDIISSGGEMANTTNDEWDSNGEIRTVAYDDEGVARRRARRNEARRRVQESRQSRRALQGNIEPSADTTSSGVETNQLSRGVELTAPMSEQQTQERQSGVSIDAIMRHIDNVNKETLNKTDQEIGALAEIRSVLLDILNVSKQAGQGQATTNEPRVSQFDQATFTNAFGG